MNPKGVSDIGSEFESHVVLEAPPPGFKTRATKAAASEGDDGPGDGDPEASPDAAADDAELAACGATEDSQ